MDKIIIMGRPDEEETLLRVDAAINKNTAMRWHRNDHFGVRWDTRGSMVKLFIRDQKTRCFPGAAGKGRVCLWQAGDHHAENPQSAGRISV